MEELIDGCNNVVTSGIDTKNSPIIEDTEPSVDNEGEKNPPLKEGIGFDDEEASNHALCNGIAIHSCEQGDPKARLCETQNFGALAINIMPIDNYIVQIETVSNTGSFKVNDSQPLMKLKNLMEVSPISSNLHFQKTTNGELHSQNTCLDHGSNNNDVNSKYKDLVEYNRMQEEHKKFIDSAGDDHPMITSTCLEHEAVASNPQQESSHSTENKCLDYETNHMRTLDDDSKSTTKEARIEPQIPLELKEVGDDKMMVNVRKSFKFDGKARLACDKGRGSIDIKNADHKTRLHNGSKGSKWQSITNNLKNEIPRKRKLDDIDEPLESSKKLLKYKGHTHKTRDSYDAKTRERDYRTRTCSTNMDSKTAPKSTLRDCRREGVKGVREGQHKFIKTNGIDGSQIRRGSISSISGSTNHNHNGKYEKNSKPSFPLRKTQQSVRSSHRTHAKLRIFEDERRRSVTPPSRGFDNRYHHRFGGYTSGLGGYSPRKRRTQAATKTPSPPPPRLPECRQKHRAWDMTPPGLDHNVIAAITATHVAQQKQTSMTLSMQSGPNPMSLNVPIFPPIATFNPSICHRIMSPVTLTHGTRSVRRLYIGNIPSTVSDGELLEFMNAAMLSINAHHLPGTKPCINCTVHIEKAYAFAEFITPEDATTALGLDGVTLHGTILKIRRPKDFIPHFNGSAPIAPPTINMVSDIVEDSPHKIFIGGISSSLTSDKTLHRVYLVQMKKVKEIVTAFGQLKAYHWERMNQMRPIRACAFLEYVDPKVTLKACAGLNGMKLGGSYLTVVRATPDIDMSKILSTTPPFYGIPKEALPLLETPTNVLELRNLVSEQEVVAMSEEQIDEFEEDVRLECRRFGNIRSMHLVKPPPSKDLKDCVVKAQIEAWTCEEAKQGTNNTSLTKQCQQDSTQPPNSVNNTPSPSRLPSLCAHNVVKDCLHTIEPNACKTNNVECVDVGCIYIEYSREESACQAAHALHGRNFNHRPVAVAYISTRAYKKRFGKGLRAPTLEERQALALAVQSHLTAHLKE